MEICPLKGQRKFQWPGDARVQPRNSTDVSSSNLFVCMNSLYVFLGNVHCFLFKVHLNIFWRAKLQVDLQDFKTFDRAEQNDNAKLVLPVLSRH